MPFAKARISADLYRKKYLILTGVFSAFIVIGFWPYISGLIQSKNGNYPLIIHVHAAVFFGWLGILFTQAGLIYKGNIQAHMKVGKIGIIYGFGILFLGLITAFLATANLTNSGAITMFVASGFIMGRIWDMSLFGGFFLAAVYYRKTPSVHKRLMLFATLALAIAPMTRILEPTDYPILFYPFWVSPIFVAIAFDWLRHRKIERVYIVGLVIMFIGSLRGYVVSSDMARVFGEWLLSPLIT